MLECNGVTANQYIQKPEISKTMMSKWRPLSKIHLASTLDKDHDTTNKR